MSGDCVRRLCAETASGDLAARLAEWPLRQAVRGDLKVIDPEGFKMNSVAGVKRRLQDDRDADRDAKRDAKRGAKPDAKRGAKRDAEEDAEEDGDDEPPPEETKREPPAAEPTAGRSRRARTVVNYSEQASTSRLSALVKCPCPHV